MTLTDSPVFAVCMMIAGLAAGMTWYAFRLKKNSLPVRAAVLAAVTGSVLALIFAKLGYLLHDMSANIIEGYYDEVTEISPWMLSFVCGCLGIVAGVAAGAPMCGIKAKKALDLFAAPACVFLCLARLAEGGMDTIGTGSEVEASWLQWFPLTMTDSWGESWYLCVFFLEALWALICLVPALRVKQAGDRDGDVFARTAVWMLGAQIGFEMYLKYPFDRCFYTSFVSLDQVFCAILLVILVTVGCMRNKKWWPLPVMLLLLGLNAFMQFYRDNKITFLWEEGWEWFAENAVAVSKWVFFPLSIALIAVGLKALSPKEKAKI